MNSVYAADLISEGRCSALCLLAQGEGGTCTCRCRGEYHGALADAEVPAGRKTLRSGYAEMCEECPELCEPRDIVRRGRWADCSYRCACGHSWGRSWDAAFFALVNQDLVNQDDVELQRR